MRRKAEDAAKNPSSPVLTLQQQARQAEYELQKKLHEQYQEVQDIDLSKKTYSPDKTA